MKQQFNIEILLKPLKDFYLKYKNWIIAVTSTVGLVVLLLIIVVIRLHQTKQYVLQRLLTAEAYLYQKNFADGYKILDEIVNHYKNTKYAGYAMYLKANSLYENKDYISAKSLYENIIKINKPKSVIVPSMYMLGLCLMNLSSFDEAINWFNKIVQKYADSIYTPRVYEMLALCYEQTGDTQSAKSVYEKMNVLYPGSYWSTIAQKKLQ